MKLTREQVLKVLKEHGWEPTSLTAVNPNKRDASGEPEWVPGTFFDDQMGIKAEYDKKAVYAWLGY